MRTRTRTTRTARGGRRAGGTTGIRAAAAGAVIATGLLASACGPAATGAGTPAPPTTTVSAAPLADAPGSATSTPAATASDAPTATPTATPPAPTRTATHRPAPVTTTHRPAPTVHHTASSGSGSGSGSGGSTHRTEAPVAPGGGATAKCNDGTYSYSQHHRGTCSHHGGVAVFYK